MSDGRSEEIDIQKGRHGTLAKFQVVQRREKIGRNRRKGKLTGLHETKKERKKNKRNRPEKTEETGSALVLTLVYRETTSNEAGTCPFNSSVSMAWILLVRPCCLDARGHSLVGVSTSIEGTNLIYQISPPHAAETIGRIFSTALCVFGRA